MQVKNEELKKNYQILKNCLLNVKRKLALLLILKIPTIKKAVELLNSIGVLKLTAINFKKTNIMKKMLFGLIATVMLSVSGNAQIETKEDARLAAAKSFVLFKNQLSEAFNKSKDYASFEKNVCGEWRNTNEGKYLLNEAFNHLSNKTTDEKIIATYDGIGVAKALKFQQDALTKNPKSSGSELFGGPGDDTTGNYNPTSKAYPCRWWQLKCHLNQIFGDELGGIILDGIICLALKIC